MESTELIREEYNWTEKAVVGLALRMIGGTIDSFGNQIKGDVFYEVGKHKVSGVVALLPTEKNQKHEFVNDVMKRTGKFN